MTIKSMTAYGRASAQTPFGHFTVELQAVNRKHLEIMTSLPSELIKYDADIKKWLSESIGRGQINAKLTVYYEKDSPLVIIPNIPLAKQLADAWRKISKEIGLKLSSDALYQLLAQEKKILVQEEQLADESAYKEALYATVQQALQQLLSMKETEGRALQKDILIRLNNLGIWIKEIAEKSPNATTRYRQKLLEKLQEVLGSTLPDDEKLLKEVCIYAERIDIAEELTRFESHIKQAVALVNTKSSQGVGKTLEFLLQELNRETNTIGSKSSDIDVSRLVIDIKSELERIREQIQNIE